MKRISVLIPTFNEEENIGLMISSLQKLFREELSGYQYEILIIDNDSTDNTRAIIRTACQEDPWVKAIFNEKNFGWLRSPFYGLLQTTGDCAILLCADFQDPLSLIPRFVSEWEQGSQVVIGQKTKSGENRLIWYVRTLYYKIVKIFSDTGWIEHFTGFGLYDRKFLEILKNLDDPVPFLRGYIAEFSGHPKIIEYMQPKRQRGKSWGNFSRLYDTAMVSITSYTKIGLRIATFIGFFVGLFSFLIGIGYLIYKLTHWFTFSAGIIPLVVGVFFLGGIQLIFLGILGEYILSINERVRNRPLVIEKERLNFENNPKSDNISLSFPEEAD